MKLKRANEIQDNFEDDWVLLHITNYYKMVVINTMYYQCRDRQANVVELESPATDRNTSGNLVYKRWQ